MIWFDNVTQFVDNDIIDALATRLNESIVQKNSACFRVAAPTSLHRANAQGRRLIS